ncbi:MAG: hypothetical protein D6679_01985 [Candidatus Hydrogenedentota bacterium]|nr:MAG: hypothetical protein D6679_01985 [Candidatus Hydrogenedentota bacterium]
MNPRVSYNRRRVQLATVTIIGCGIAYFHFKSIQVNTPLHAIHYRLLYLPVLLSAVWFGRVGGILTALIVTAVFLPHIILRHAYDPFTDANVYLEFFIINVVGWLVGELVTRRIRVEGELAEARRLASLGEIAAGIAHEIKNPAQTIRGALDLALKLDEPEARNELLTTARKETERLDTLASGFMALSRPPTPRIVDADLPELLRRTEERFRLPGGREGIEVICKGGEAPRSLRCDPEQISQVLLNLFSNAAAAMRGEGVIHVELREEPRGWLRIIVTDSGKGIEEGMEKEIFVPFRSKRPGGTGLGLPVSRGIIEAHGGRLEYDGRDPNLGGARFVVEIPIGKGQEE